MIVAKLVISNNSPSMKDVIWAKPENDGFTLYMLTGGRWLPLKVNNNTEEKINYEQAGAAEAVKKALVGTKRDSKNAMTLHGLKAYIDDVIAKEL